MRPAMHLYITHALYFEIYSTLFEVLQLISIAGYEAYVCMCFFVYKTLFAAFIISIMKAANNVVASMCFYTALKKNLYIKFDYKKVLEERNTF